MEGEAEPALHARGQLVQRLGHVRMLGPVGSLLDIERLLEKSLCFLVAAEGDVEPREAIQGMSEVLSQFDAGYSSPSRTNVGPCPRWACRSNPLVISPMK